MSHCDDECTQDPCVCETPRTTYCDRDRRNNVWIEGGDHETGEGGVCLLDNLHEDQLIYILERDEIARRDLLKVTSDPYLLDKARTVQRLSTDDNLDGLSKALDKPSIPFYTAFAGNPPFAQ
jgi:hypothetical protein